MIGTMFVASHVGAGRQTSAASGSRPRSRPTWTRRELLAGGSGALGVLLAACGGAAPGSTTPTGAGPAAEAGELEWSQWGSNADFAIAQAQVDAYNATQPKVRVKANLLTGNYLEKLQAMVSAG